MLHAALLTPPVLSFGRGEGVVSIVLKPLDAALRDNDKIYATVRSDDILIELSADETPDPRHGRELIRFPRSCERSGGGRAAGRDGSCIPTGRAFAQGSRLH